MEKTEMEDRMDFNKYKKKLKKEVPKIDQDISKIKENISKSQELLNTATQNLNEFNLEMELDLSMHGSNTKIVNSWGVKQEKHNKEIQKIEEKVNGFRNKIVELDQRKIDIDRITALDYYNWLHYNRPMV